MESPNGDSCAATVIPLTIFGDMSSLFNIGGTIATSRYKNGGVGFNTMA